MISLIATVLNEGDSIRRLLDSILAQTRLPDDIVIVDGGSADDTVAILESYRDRLPLRILSQPGCNISAGRNRAIREARGQIVAVTDAGVRLSESWLEGVTAPLASDLGVDVVAGFFEADPQNRFELALAATTLPLSREINPESFLPSSRSIAFRKSAAEAAGLYPEWLDYCEDLVLDLRLKAGGQTLRLRAGRNRPFSTALVAGRLLTAVLSLRPRRWQSQPLAETASHSLRNLPAACARDSRAGPGD